MNEAIIEARSVLEALKAEQPGLVLDILERGFAELWNIATDRRLDQLIIQRWQATDIPISAFDTEKQLPGAFWQYVFDVNITVQKNGWDYRALMTRKEFIDALADSTIEIANYSALFLFWQEQ